MSIESSNFFKKTHLISRFFQLTLYLVKSIRLKKPLFFKGPATRKPVLCKNSCMIVIFSLYPHGAIQKMRSFEARIANSKFRSKASLTVHTVSNFPPIIRSSVQNIDGSICLRASEFQRNPKNFKNNVLSAPAAPAKKDVPLVRPFCWCRWWDSNPHDVAINGF